MSNAAVAHVVERSSEKAEVASASLARGTKVIHILPFENLELLGYNKIMTITVRI